MTENQSTDDGSTETQPTDDGSTERETTTADDQSDSTVVRETVIKDEGRSPVEYIELAALAGLIVLAAIAGIGFYTSASSAISRLIATSYEPMFQAAFNLVLLLVALAGLSVLARRRFDLA